MCHECELDPCVCPWSSGVFFFFFQAEDGIRDLVRSRGLGDVYKRQGSISTEAPFSKILKFPRLSTYAILAKPTLKESGLSLIHI